MKQLILFNSKGEKYDLLDVGISPTFQIEGLGYESDMDFLQIGDNYIPVNDKSKQGEITIEILFWKNADVTYQRFVKHTRRSGDMHFLYENDAGTFYIPCRLKSISKVDRLRYSMLGCEAEFFVTGKPYRVVSSYNKGTTSAGKNYGTEGYTYNYTYSNDMLNTVLIRSDSVLRSPCILTIYGEVVNPVWRHYSNGVLVESGAYDGTIPEGNMLVIDTKSVPFSIIEYDSRGNVVADRYAKCDFSLKRFMYADEGENRYSVSHDSSGENAVKMKAEVYIQYDSV